MKKIMLASVLSISAMPLQAESNFTWEILLGTADQETSAFDFSTSGDDTSLGIRGAYLFNKNIAFELAYQKHGEADDTFVDNWGYRNTAKMETAALNFGVLGITPLSKNFSIVSRFGLSMWDYDLTRIYTDYPDEHYMSRDDGTDIYYGIGARYKLNDNLFINAEYTVSDMRVKLFGYLPVDHEVINTSISLGINF